MFNRKKKLILPLLVIILVAMVVVCEAAQSWKPTRTIKLMVTSAPGGAYDAIARQVARTMPDYLGKGTKIIIQNVPGGGGLLGIDRLARSKPDGHTFMLTSLGAYAALALKSPLKVKASDLTILAAVVADSYGVLGSVKNPYRSFNDILNSNKEIRIAVAGTNFAIIGLVSFFEEKNIRYSAARFQGSGFAEVPIRSGDADLYIAAISAIGLRCYLDGDCTPPFFLFANERDKRFPDTPTHIEFGMPKEWSALRILCP
jgi:tripartite-type tricarboxylate transporter receptor subunit TctC